MSQVSTGQSDDQKVIALDGAAAKFNEWYEAETAAKAARIRADALKIEFGNTLKVLGASAGTVFGVPVLRRTQTAAFRGADFAKTRPDLAEQYTVQVVANELDVAAIARDLPALYEEYRTVQLRPDWKAFSAAMAARNLDTRTGQ